MDFPHGWCCERGGGATILTVNHGTLWREQRDYDGEEGDGCRGFLLMTH